MLHIHVHFHTQFHFCSFYPAFIVYVIFVVTVASILMVIYAPKYGTSNVVIYVAICSVIGSLSVMGCKGLGLALRETFAGRNEFTSWVTWVCLIGVILCISVQMNYLNKVTLALLG